MADGQRPVPVTADLLAAADEVITSAAASGVILRLLGGIAVFQLSASARRPPLARSYHDFDVVVASGMGPAAAKVFLNLGYGEDAYFNALHGAQRMVFTAASGFVVDLLVGTFQMCHRLRLGSDLPDSGLTIHPADLLLTKMQIVQIEEKDLLDAAALLVDLPPATETGIEIDRFVAPLAGDWGFFHTVELNLPKVAGFAAERLKGTEARRVERGVQELRQAMDAVPKSLRWKARARVGERIPWYDLPEEID
ncbi:MAG: hypothetical protein LBV34_06875 [Nocardiopsaceae bacterium]|jgi:hypothetical protein|nr:hypothetical protein [Nocardiopsaceae bacterium]